MLCLKFCPYPEWIMHFLPPHFTTRCIAHVSHHTLSSWVQFFDSGLYIYKIKLNFTCPKAQFKYLEINFSIHDLFSALFKNYGFPISFCNLPTLFCSLPTSCRCLPTWILQSNISWNLKLQHSSSRLLYNISYQVLDIQFLHWRTRVATSDC